VHRGQRVAGGLWSSGWLGKVAFLMFRGIVVVQIVIVASIEAGEGGARR